MNIIDSEVSAVSITYQSAHSILLISIVPFTLERHEDRGKVEKLEGGYKNKEQVP